MKKLSINKTAIILAALLFLIIIAFILYVLLENKQKVGDIRSVPYPYASMLAICSDIDGSTLEEFERIHKYLNSDESNTYLGNGLGLDIADSFWMYAVNNDGVIHDSIGSTNTSIMSYFKVGANDKKHANQIIKYFENGWIDAIHSYGDFSQVDVSKPVFTKEHAQIANKEMVANSLLPTIWINHGNNANVQNMKNPSANNDILSYQQGSNHESKYYHADFTIPAGIKFVWFSDSSSKFSEKTPLYPVTLEDGQKVWGFRRYTGEGAISKHVYNWSVYGIHEQLSKKHLDNLVKKGGISIVAQHLGGSSGDYTFPGSAKEGFERLKQYQINDQILVARTSRLLEFARVRDNIVYSYDISSTGEEVINLISINDPQLGSQKIENVSMVKGISVVVKNAKNAKIFINGNEVTDESLIARSKEKDTAQSIGIKWYEKDVNDYSPK